MRLIEGDSVARAAQALGISVNTARTQLKSVFAKTGCNRQSDLIRVVLTSPAYLANPPR
jgi:DNA-binding CsgD family transcriptional regulator